MREIIIVLIIVFVYLLIGTFISSIIEDEVDLDTVILWLPLSGLYIILAPFFFVNWLGKKIRNKFTK